MPRKKADADPVEEAEEAVEKAAEEAETAEEKAEEAIDNAEEVVEAAEAELTEEPKAEEKPKRRRTAKAKEPEETEEDEDPKEDTPSDDMSESDENEKADGSEMEPFYMEPEAPRRKRGNRASADTGESEEAPAKKSKKTSMSGYMSEMRSDPTISLTGEVRASTAIGRKMDAYQELLTSRQSGRILTGTIAEVPNNPKLPHAIVYYGPFRVMIPFDKLISDRHEPVPEGMSEGIAQNRMLTRRLGADIDFIVTDIDRENNLAGGDRMAAMAVTRRMFLNQRNPDGTPLIRANTVNENGVQQNDGSKLECHVMCVLHRRILVETHGIEGEIPTSELYWTYESEGGFAPGDMIEARIMEIRDKETDNPYLILSKRRCEDDPFDIYGRDLKGSVISGNIINPTDGLLQIRLSNGVYCLAERPTSNRAPIARTGDRCSVEITDVDDKRHRVYGRVRYISSNMGR